MSALPASDDLSAIRRALIAHAARSLKALPQAPTVEELTGWLAPVPTLRLVACLGQSPNDTATRLAGALSVAKAATAPRAGIAELAATEFPELDPATLERLIGFTEALREIAIEREGTVTAADLFHKGFRSAEAAALMPRATHLMHAMAGSARPRRDARAPLAPIEALRVAGSLASTLALARAATA